MLLEPRMQERLCPTKYPLYPLRFVAWVPNSMECESSCREQPIRLNPTLPSRLISICPTDSFRQKPTSQWRSGLRQLTGTAGAAPPGETQSQDTLPLTFCRGTNLNQHHQSNRHDGSSGNQHDAYTIHDGQKVNANVLSNDVGPFDS
jgi:hypothetical protein